jgi:hypothetical protein
MSTLISIKFKEEDLSLVKSLVEPPHHLLYIITKIPPGGSKLPAKRHEESRVVGQGTGSDRWT